MKNSIIKFDAPELNVIEKSKAEQIKNTFEPMVKMLEDFEESYNEVIKEASDEITKEVTEKAKRIRIDIGKVRIQTDKIRKEQKEEYLRAGKAIDGVSNILKWAVSEKENKLKEIENYFEIKEKERLQAIQKERVEKLSLYVEDAEERNLSVMDDDVWIAYFNSKKKDYEDMVEAEKKAEQERIEKEKAEELERQRIKKENEKLKKEAEERERIEKIESDKRAKEEAERLKKEEAERKAREEERAKAEEEKRKLEEKLKAKEEAERKAREEEEAKKQAELQKGDIDKVKDLIYDLEFIKTKYHFDSAKNNKIYLIVNKKIDEIIKTIKGEKDE